MDVEKEVEEVKRRALKFLPITIIIALSIMFVYSKIVNVDVRILLKLDLKILLILIILMGLIPLINGLRMSYIAETIGIRDRVGGIIARIASQFAALVTPSTAGAYAIKAYWVKRNGKGWDSGLGIALTDSFFDSLVVNTIVLYISLINFFAGKIIFLPIVLVSASSLINSLILFSVTINQRLRAYILKISKAIKLSFKEENLENFGKTFLSMLKKPSRFIFAIFLTILSLFSQAAVVLIVAMALDINSGIFDAIIFVAIGQVMGGLPSPAGAGLIEFGVSLIAVGELVLTWRILTFTFSLIYYAAFFQIFIMRYLVSRN